MLKPQIYKQKNTRGKITGYQAILCGQVGASSRNAAEAIAEWEKETVNTLERLDRGPITGVLLDHHWIVIPNRTGWAYWIDIFSPQYGFQDAGGSDDRDKAIDRAIHHLAQALWSADMDDHDLLSNIPRSIRGELATWIGFQRSYIRIKAAGELTGENDIHNAAINMSYLYAREHFAAYLAR